MWITGKVDQTSQKDTLFNDLYQECRLAAPGARLSYSLRTRLERFHKEERKDIVSKVKEGCAPLFIACKKGNVEIVEYLLIVCLADGEQRGMYEVPDDKSVHNVTPLWCASVSGRLPVVRCLVQHGAKVNSVSDTGSTPVRSACFMTHLDIVVYLVENGADILQPNYNGGTCLINSVQSVPLCDYLLKHGAQVNAQDIQQKTALHYAIQEHRFETTVLLLQYGANPYLRSRYNDDALQTACLKGARQVFDYLIKNVSYPPERIADAYELMGSTFLDEHHDIQMALDDWRKAAEIRYGDPSNTLPKAVQAPRVAYQNAVEFETLEELENIVLDLDAMRIQSLLISERILGVSHKDMIFRLMYRGAAYADALQYQLCIDLWRYALELRVQKDSVLYPDTCFTAQALVKLFIDLYEKHTARVLKENVKFSDVMSTVDLLASQFAESIQLLDIQPVYKRQQDSFDRTLRCLTHLLHLLLITIATPVELDMVHKKVNSILQINPRTTTGDTLLHLTVSRANTIKSNSFFDDNQVTIFPSLEVTRLLLDCGAKVNSTNDKLSTALHVATEEANYNENVVQLLLDHGAHMDQRNSHGIRPCYQLQNNPNCDLNPFHHTTLKCLAAQVIALKNICYRGEVPIMLETFIEMH